MSKPNYTSTPNPAYQVTKEDGTKTTIWHSRSCAVTMIGAFYNREEDDFYIPMGRRGPAAADNNGKWCLPCGYIDWDETGTQAAYRETWEEIGLPLEHLTRQAEAVEYLIAALDDQPWNVSHYPTADAKQNVTLHFASVMEWEGDLPELTLENNEVEGEVDEARWFKYSDIEKMSPEEFAFDHDGKLRAFMKTMLVYMAVYNGNKKAGN